MTIDPPAGFGVYTASAGLLDDGRDDLTVILSDVPAVSAAMFTRSRFAGPSVCLSRDAARAHRFRGVVVLARNANVATGVEGAAHAAEVRRRVAEKVGVGEEELIIAPTGVIGVNYPMASVRAALDRLPYPFPPVDFAAAARAIMTTDTRPKIARVRSGAVAVVEAPRDQAGGLQVRQLVLADGHEVGAAEEHIGGLVRQPSQGASHLRPASERSWWSRRTPPEPPRRCATNACGWPVSYTTSSRIRSA